MPVTQPTIHKLPHLPPPQSGIRRRLPAAKNAGKSTNHVPPYLNSLTMDYDIDFKLPQDNF
jgi:hypothetical protein